MNLTVIFSCDTLYIRLATACHNLGRTYINAWWGDYMFKELNKKIMGLKKSIRQRDKLNKRVEKINIEIEKEKQRFYMLEELLDEEKYDVDKLEELSVSNLILSIMGSKKSRMAKEKNDYLVARLKYDECKLIIHSLMEQKSQFEEKLKEYSDVDKSYRELLDKKEQLIKENSGVDRDLQEENLRLIELSEVIADREDEIEDFEEAIEAGNEVLQYVEKLMNILNNSNNIGFFSNIIKSGELKEKDIEKVKALAYHTREHMSKFKRRILDINELRGFKNNPINIGSLSKMEDLFLEDFFIKSYLNKDVDRPMFNGRNLSTNIQTYVSRMLQEENNVREELKLINDTYFKIVENAK